MFCKYCGAELPGEQEVCATCAKEKELKNASLEETAPLEEETVVVTTEEAPVQPESVQNTFGQACEPSSAKQTAKPNVWMFVAIAACCAVAVLLVFIIFQGIRDANPAETTVGTTAATTPDTTTPTQAPPTAEDLGITMEGLLDNPCYSVDTVTSTIHADSVIATVGDYALTNDLLQIFYWRAFTDFATDASSQGYDLLTAYGLDINQPLYEQDVMGSVVTWEQFFLQQAIQKWQQCALTNMMADDAGYVVDEQTRKALDEVPAQLEADAVENGFADANAMLHDRIGANCDMEDYQRYMDMTSRESLFVVYYQENHLPTDEQVEEFYELNTDYYSYYGITKEAGKMAAVRHILLQPGEVDESTGMPNATEEQWEQCRADAQKLLDDWLAGDATEEAFAEKGYERSTSRFASNCANIISDGLTEAINELYKNTQE